jgi:methionyl-tRNA synthetase
VARVVSLANKFKISLRKKQIRNSDFKKEIAKCWKNYHQTLKGFRFNETLNSIWNLISFCDRYIDREKPWQKSKNQKEKIGNLLLVLGEIGKMLEPFLPETSQKILKQIQTRKPKILFPKLYQSI